jgi:hypothetical protein
MLPLRGPGGSLTGLTRDGKAVQLAQRAVKGIDYAMFDAAPGAYVAQYTGDQSATPPPPQQPPPGGPGSGAGSGSGAGTGSGSGVAGTGGSAPPATGRALIFDHTAPRIVLGGARRQRLGATVALTLRAASEDLWARVSATVRLRGQRRLLRLTTVRSRFVGKGRTAVVRLKVPAATLRRLRRALAARPSVSAAITVRARDAAGNTATRTRAVRLALR